ncbi:MATE family efflux transporter [Sulfitobacter sp. MF3-043]|uniref:MATE family efflux transporter n=1 Tax=Sulfitobacter sediminivivens TaxID=3252902 RepID=UPI003EC0F836
MALRSGFFAFRICIVALAIYFAARRNDLIAWPAVADGRAFFKPYMVIVLPAIATQMSTPVANYLLTIVMAPFGDDAVAAWAVVGRLTVVVFGGVFALSGAIGGIFGQNFGESQMARVRSTYCNARIFCLIYALVAWLLLYLTTPYVIWAFA